ncbi:MAG: hypothetical protein QNK37_32335 [Acidobacteriota bacterium]|nr:hypothetical protein [Acidobacteriota bacterium]
MINLAAGLGLALVVTLLFSMSLGVVLWASIPLGLVAGIILFIFLARKVQVELEAIMGRMQRDLQEQKFDRAVETLKSGLALKNRQFFIAGQIHSQIGSIYYVQGQKKYDIALEHLKQGFIKHYVGQGMMACIYYKRKDYDTMKEVMESGIKANKKEAVMYGLYAWLLYQLKDKEKAITVLQDGLKKLPKDERLQTNLTQLQNNKKMKMKVFGEMWTQFMLERPPRVQQEVPKHMQRQMRRRQMFR